MPVRNRTRDMTSGRQAETGMFSSRTFSRIAWMTPENRKPRAIAIAVSRRQDEERNRIRALLISSLFAAAMLSTLTCGLLLG
jgi:hypothetical protein